MLLARQKEEANMKRVLVILGIAFCMFMLASLPATAAAKKLPLTPYAGFPDLPGGGFVIINDGAGGNHNLELTVSLKGAIPNTTFEVWLENDGNPTLGPYIGTITTDEAGNGNFHINYQMEPGEYNLGIDVAIGGGDRYLTSNVYGAPIYTTFK
jgi:hypothetical protein